MKQNEIKIGETYTAKVSDRLTKVHIDSKHSSGKGWNATNLATQKRIHITSAERLRASAAPAKEPAKAEVPKPEAPKAAMPKPDQSPTAKPPTKVIPAAKAPAPDATRAKRGGDTARGDAKPKRMGALEAAAEVLKQAGRPMRATELIVAMAEQGLWESPAGSTPHATLYAAMLREARDKCAAARFKKVDRGLFAFNAEAKG